MVKHRLVAGLLQAPGFRETVLYAGYWWTGEGMSAKNADLFATFGMHVQGHGRAFALGGDFNILPQVVAKAKVDEAVDGVIVHAGEEFATCSTGSLIDYFIIDAESARAIKEVCVVYEALTAPHKPVRVSFLSAPVRLRVLRLRKPPPLPAVKVIGPLLPCKSWDEELRTATQARAAAAAGEFDFAERILSFAWKRWANSAERELEHATGADLPISGKRGRSIQLRWESVLPTNDERRSKLQRPSLRKWMASRMREASMVAKAAAPESADADGVRRDPMEKKLKKVQAIHDHCFAHAPARAAEINEWNGRVSHAQGKLRALLQAVMMARQAAQTDVEAVRLFTAWEAEIDLFDDWVAELDREAHEEAEQLAADGRRSWKRWCKQAVEGGAGAAHRFTKAPRKWVPTHTVSKATGEVVCDPLNLLEAEKTKFAGRWKASETPMPLLVGPSTEALPLLSPDELRGASESFAVRSATSFDGFHMRHFAMLCDQALVTLAIIFEVVEMIGQLPAQLRAILFALIPKARGGLRPIALFCGPYRLWARARRHYARAWEVAWRRPYFLNSVGGSAIGSVWRGAVKAEAARGRGQMAASLLWDMQAFYETIDLEKLLVRARELEFPETILRIALNTYRVARHFFHAGITLSAVFAFQGMPAGCQFATTFVMIYCLRGADAMVARNPELGFGAFIDDLQISMCGTFTEVTEGLQRGAQELENFVLLDLGADIAFDKAAVAATTRPLTDALRAKLGKWAGDKVTHAINLGVDDSAGRARGQLRRTKRKERFSAAAKRRARFRSFGKQVGKKAQRLFVSGIRPAMAYGCEVTGVTNGELQEMQRFSALALPPYGQGRSLSATLALHGDDTLTAAIGPIIQWCKEVWASITLGAERGSCLSLPELRRAWEAAVERRDPNLSWSSSRGPVSAAELSLRRMGWQWKEAFIFIDDVGEQVTVTEHSPALIRRFLKLSWQRRMERKAAQSLVQIHDLKGMQRLCIDPWRSWQRRREKFDPAGAAIARGVVAGSRWTGDRARRAGYLTSGKCPLCGEDDSVFHRNWICKPVQEERDRAAPPWFQRIARNAGARDPLYTLGLVEHPDAEAQPPLREGGFFLERYDGGDEDLKTATLEGKLYTDGSASRPQVWSLARAGWAVAVVDATGELKARLSGPVWHPLPQTSGAAEVVAAAVAHEVVTPGSHSGVRTDSELVLKLFGSHGLAGTTLYSGIVKTARGRVGADGIRYLEKVKGHVNPDTVEGEDRVKALGNDAADKGADTGREAHPPALTPSAAAVLETQIRHSHLVLNTIATIWASFPARLERCARLPLQQRIRSTRVTAHTWSAMGEAGWRCTKCWTCAATPRQRKTRELRGCKPLTLADALKNDIAENAQSHRLVVGRLSDGEPLVICMACGGWGTRKARLLRQPCRGPAKGGEEAIRRVARGRHPHCGYQTRLVESIGSGQLAELFPTEARRPSSLDPPVDAGVPLQERRKRALDLIGDMAARRIRIRQKSSPTELHK